MGKDRSFAAKLAKSAHSFGNQCPTCGETYKYVKVVSSEQHPIKNTWRFFSKNVKVCKCNEQEIIG